MSQRVCRLRLLFGTEGVVRNADAGDPSLSVLIADLDDLINKGGYWRKRDRRDCAKTQSAACHLNSKRVG